MFRDGFNYNKLVLAEDVLDFAEGSELESMIDAYLQIPILEKDKWRKMTKDARRKFVLENVPLDEFDCIVLVNMETGEVVGEGGETADLVERDYVVAVEIAYELFGVDNPMRGRQEITEIMARRTASCKLRVNVAAFTVSSASPLNVANLLVVL